MLDVTPLFAGVEGIKSGPLVHRAGTPKPDHDPREVFESSRQREASDLPQSFIPSSREGTAPQESMPQVAPAEEPFLERRESVPSTLTSLDEPGPEPDTPVVSFAALARESALKHDYPAVAQAVRRQAAEGYAFFLQEAPGAEPQPLTPAQAIEAVLKDEGMVTSHRRSVIENPTTPMDHQGLYHGEDGALLSRERLVRDEQPAVRAPLTEKQQKLVRAALEHIGQSGHQLMAWTDQGGTPVSPDQALSLLTSSDPGVTLLQVGPAPSIPGAQPGTLHPWVHQVRADELLETAQQRALEKPTRSSRATEKKLGIAGRLGNAFARLVSGSQLAPYQADLAEINALEAKVRSELKTKEDFLAKTQEFKDRLAAGETLEDIKLEAYAVAREAARLTTGMRPYDCQVIGALAMNAGHISEMKTGEGKTLTAVLPLYLNALAGKGAYLVTVNETLAKRDADWMGPIFEHMGLKVGCVLESQNHDEKRANYGCDVTYITDRAFGFDYMRDRTETDPSKRVQRREMFFALVDEVDDILIDEARTPLIISRRDAPAADEYTTFDGVVKSLVPGEDYEVDHKFHQVWLTEHGERRVANELSILEAEEALAAATTDQERSDAQAWKDSCLALRDPLRHEAKADLALRKYDAEKPGLLKRTLGKGGEWSADERERLKSELDQAAARREEASQGVPEYDLYSDEHSERVRYLTASLKANGLFRRNKDYIVTRPDGAITRVRKQLDLDQEQFAQVLGVSEADLRNVETGASRDAGGVIDGLRRFASSLGPDHPQDVWEVLLPFRGGEGLRTSYRDWYFGMRKAGENPVTMLRAQVGMTMPAFADTIGVDLELLTKVESGDATYPEVTAFHEAFAARPFEDHQAWLKNGEVKIVDENKGRTSDGRRYNEGLHQALEAKEGVEIQPEQRTVASITYPNLFKQFARLAGMTGTGKTSEAEFIKFYGLDVVEVPTNRPLARVDYADEVFALMEEKYNAVADECVKAFQEGVPVLTTSHSVQSCHYLAKKLLERGIPEGALQLVDAKSIRGDKEAENKRIAQAGISGVITVATNMAGRGADIKPDLVTFKKLAITVNEAVSKNQPVVVHVDSEKEAKRVSQWLDRIGPHRTEMGDAGDPPASGETVVRVWDRPVPDGTVRLRGWHFMDVPEGDSLTEATPINYKKIAEVAADELTKAPVIVDLDSAEEAQNLAAVLGLPHRVVPLDAGETAAPGEVLIRVLERPSTPGATELRNRDFPTYGLYHMGTERGKNRRTDNQTRGRSGRQGAWGRSKFFLSLQDDLLMLFGGMNLKPLLDLFGKPGQGLAHPRLDSLIDKAQQSVESNHFAAREQTTEYDEVLNKQRDVWYDFREDLVDLHPRSTVPQDERIDLGETVVDFATDAFVETVRVEAILFQAEQRVEREVEDHREYLSRREGLSGPELDAAVEEYRQAAVKNEFERLGNVDRDHRPSKFKADVAREAVQRAQQQLGLPVDIEIKGRSLKLDEVREQAAPAIKTLYEEAVALPQIDETQLDYQVAQAMVELMSRNWTDHLENMDALKLGVRWVSLIGQEPEQAYKLRGFDEFAGLMDRFKADTTRAVFPELLRYAAMIREHPERFAPKSAA